MQKKMFFGVVIKEELAEQDTIVMQATKEQLDDLLHFKIL